MHLLVNGEPHDVHPAGSTTLLELLREELHLTGTKLVCDRGECGACTVLLDGEPAYACLVLAAACAASEVTTIEGIGRGDDLHPVQRAFIEQDAVQCGFCTPGQVLAAVALLRAIPDPSEEEIAREMSGNLCRCGTYPAIVRAIRNAGLEMRRNGD